MTIAAFNWKTFNYQKQISFEKKGETQEEILQDVHVTEHKPPKPEKKSNQVKEVKNKDLFNRQRVYRWTGFVAD